MFVYNLLTSVLIHKNTMEKTGKLLVGLIDSSISQISVLHKTPINNEGVHTPLQ